MKPGERMTIDFAPGCPDEGRYHGLWPLIQGGEAVVLPGVAPVGPNNPHTIRTRAFGHWQYFTPDELRYAEPQP